jgi:uncharacterized protein (DUF1800 family)
LNERKAEQMANLVSWWTQRMYNSPAPLVEKMTLFWHGHFATSTEKVNSYRMWLQNETLRMYALGNFGTLVKAISCDPALIEALANKFREARYEIRPLLKTIFASEEFHSDRAREGTVKSPVQYIIQARRTLGLTAPSGHR